MDLYKRYSRFVIKCPGGISGTTVEIDGVKVHGLTDISFEHSVGSLPKVVLKGYATEVLIEGNDADVVRVCLCPACKVEQDELVRLYEMAGCPGIVTDDASARRAGVQIGVNEQPLNPEGF